MIKVDTTQFSRAAAQLLTKSSRTSVDFLNGQALAVAARAIKLTEKADANKIAIQMGQIGTEVKFSKKAGKRRTRRIYDTSVSSLAHRIINARRIKKGEPPIWGDELDKQARRMVTGRLRATAFIKSGWIYAVRQLANVVKGRRPSTAGESVQMKGQPKGWAKPAKQVSPQSNATIVSEIGNSALIALSKSGTRSNPMPLAARGLQAALDLTAKDMMQEYERRLRPVVKEHSAR